MNRVIPGLCMAVGWLLLLFVGNVELFWGVALVGAVLALHEFFRMVMPSLTGVWLLATIGSCLFSVLGAFWGNCDVVLGGLVVSLLLVVAIALQGFGKMEDVLKYATSSGFASVYIALCLAHMVLIRHLPQGSLWLTMLVGIVAGSDTGAYYAGRAFGKRKLFPLISPKKTVAGGVGGIVTGIAVAEGINLMLPVTIAPVPLAISAALLITVGIAGDLTESLIKRSVGVKDSGTILLGHGGILDRIDSLLLTAPILYYLLHFGILQ